MSGGLRRAAPAALVVAAPLVLVLTALRPGTFLFGYDILNTFYYLRGVVGDALAHGRLPAWDPHVTCGSPLLAAMQSAVFYPLTWPAALLGPGPFWTFTVAVHLSLAGAFAFLWLRRGLGLSPWASAAGAAVVALSGYAATHVYGGHLTLISAYPWAPALLWRLERFLAGPSPRRAATLAAAFALMILAGFPQLVLIAGLAGAARLAHHVLEEPEGRKSRARAAGGAAAVLGLGVLLAAPQLLPTFELIGEAQRGSVNDYAFATSYSMPPENLITLLAPTFFGDGRSVPYWGRWYLWEVTGFVGLSTLALAAAGLAGRHRQRFLWGGVALLGLLLALGRHTPLYGLFYYLVPGADFFRGPARYLLLLTLGMAPLAAMGIDRLREGDARLLSRRIAVGAGVLAALLGIACLFVLSGDGMWKELLADEAEAARGIREEAGLSGPGFEAASRQGALRSLGWSAAILGAIAAALALRRPSAVGAILGLELAAFGARYFVAHPEQDMRWTPEVVERYRSRARPPCRFATVLVGQTDAIGKCQLAGLDHVGGYDPLMLRRYTELVNASQGAKPGAPVTAMIPGRTGPVTDLLGVRFWAIPGRKRSIPGWVDAEPLGATPVYENPSALPRAFLAARSKVIGDDEARIRHLCSAAFRPREELVLDEGREETLATGTAEIVVSEPGRYEIRTESAGESWLVLTEAFYPGWWAKIDRAPAAIVRADHFVQALRLPAGRHEVSFGYRSRLLPAGLLLAGLGGGILAGAALLRKKRENPAGPPIIPKASSN